MAKRNPLRINVGFLVKADAGYSRTIEFDVGEMVLSEDFTVRELKGSVTFGRTPQGLVAEVALSGRTAADCVRCLEPFDQAIATEFTELYAFDERSVTEAHLLVPPSHQIDLAPLAREYLLLDMPITPLCRPDCKGLCVVCGANRNQQECGHAQHPQDPQPPADEAPDPRFAALKDLLDPKE
ncbi:MAG: DUF177 domain-containing protein [Anaerolineales bacterium]|jgi:uncharacterized protein|nr:DUF177 domain-containing protein [Anaerolineales bacterium]MCW5838729.1 DUF177 domain-containing protein [Anaerolineales bacterium]